MKRKLKIESTSNGEMNPRNFFRLMISPTSYSKMSMPRKFASAFRDEVCGACTLTVPTGETKKVAVEEEDNKLWFQDGWQEFVDYFSVCYGYFLMFTYEGNSAFTVLIFDLTACEISYRCDSRSISPAAGEPCHGNLSADDADTDDTDTMSHISLHSPSARPNNYDVEVRADSEHDEIKVHEGSKYKSNKKEKYEGTPLRYPSWLINFEDVLETVAAAGIPIPENPFFIALIKRYNIFRGHYLTIPTDFAREHLRDKMGHLITLETSDGRQWVIRYCWNKCRCTLSKGWIVFAREIGLVVGDVCVFELSDAENYVLKVQVLKKSELKDANLTTVLCTSARPDNYDMAAVLQDSEDGDIKPLEEINRNGNTKEKTKGTPLVKPAYCTSARILPDLDPLLI